MKKLGRTLPILLAIIMTLSLFACTADSPATAPPTTPDSPSVSPPASTPPAPPASVEPGTTTEPITDEEVTIKVMQWALDNQSTDFENLWYYKQLEEKTNVKVEWIVVKESDWDERLNLMFSSLDWPDVIIRPAISLSIEEYGVMQGVLEPLDEYIPQYMPNYNALLQYNNVTETIRASDGKMYYLGYLVAQNINHEAHYFINQTWLNEVGKEIPKTIDELTDVLRAFKAQKPGADGMYPMSAGGGLEHHVEGIYTYFGMFGVPLTRYVYATIQDDGKVVFTGQMDGFREACEWLSLCYKEGLLDPDALTQDENSWNEKVNSNKVGFQTYLRLINSAWANPDTIQNWVSILPPSTDRGAKLPRLLEIPQYGAVITSTNKHIPETLNWLDAQFETERMMTAANGPSEMTDDVKAVLGTDAKDTPPLVFENGVWKVSYVPENNALYKIVPVTQGQFFAPGDFYFGIYELPPHRIERKNYSAEYAQAGVIQKNSYMILSQLVKKTPEDDAELKRLFTDIETLMKERISNFIINGVTDETWNAFLTEAENVGVNRYTAIYQRYFDAYKAVQ